METDARGWGLTMSNFTNNLTFFCAGFFVREMILRAKSQASEEDSMSQDFLEKLQSYFRSSPKALHNAVGYVLYKPEPPLSLDMTVEACVSDVTSALEAFRGGCNSLELCVDRPQGGVTPGSVFIENVSSRLRSRGVQIQVLIRPRPGSFVYTDEEFELIQSEIRMAKEAGATGIVAGILTNSGFIHRDRMAIIKSLCTSLGLLLTFHRAFDVCADSSDTALEIVTALGCERILTSGRKDRVTDDDALQLVERLHRISEGKVQVVAGAGITPGNVSSIISATGVRAVHCGSGITSKVIHNYGKGAKEGYGDSSSVQDGLNAAWDQVDSAKAASLAKNASAAWAAAPDLNHAAVAADATPQPGPQNGVHSYIVIDDDHEGVQEHSDSPPPAPAALEDRAPSSSTSA